MLVKTLIAQQEVPVGAVGTVIDTGEEEDGTVWYDVIFHFLGYTVRYSQEDLEPVDA